MVKCQAIDIANIISSLIWRWSIVQPSCRNRKWRCELLSPSEVHRSTTKSGGVCDFLLTLRTHNNACCGSTPFCRWLACVPAGVRGAAYQTVHAVEPPENALLYRQALAREILVFLCLFVLKRTVAMGFPEEGVSRSKEGYQRWYRASLGRYLRGQIFVKTVMYRCHNLLKDVLFLFDERGFLAALPFE